MQQNQFGTVAPQPVQVQVPSPVPARSRHSCAVKSLGILQMISAGLSVVLGIVYLVVGFQFGVIGSGIWGGLLFYLPAGILGVLSVTVSVPSRKGLAIACMVMSILSAVVATANTGYYCAAAIFDNYNFQVNYLKTNTPIVLDSLLAILSFFELVFAIVASVYCCLIMSELRSSTSTVVQYVPSSAYPNMNTASQPASPYTTDNVPPAATDQAYGNEKGNLA